MSRSLSSIIREYEQLQGGRLVEVRRWHNFLLRGGMHFQTQNGNQLPEPFQVDGSFLIGVEHIMPQKEETTGNKPQWTSEEILQYFFQQTFGTQKFEDVLGRMKWQIEGQTFNEEFIRQLIDWGILEGYNPLRWGNITQLLSAEKNATEWIPATRKSGAAFAFQRQMALSEFPIDNIVNFESVMTFLPLQCKHQGLYNFFLLRINQICNHEKRRGFTTRYIKEHTDKFRDNVGNYKEIVKQTISNVTDEGLKKQLEFLVHAFNTLEGTIDDIVAYNPEEEGGARKRARIPIPDGAHIEDLT